MAPIRVGGQCLPAHALLPPPWAQQAVRVIRTNLHCLLGPRWVGFVWVGTGMAKRRVVRRQVCTLLQCAHLQVMCARGWGGCFLYQLRPRRKEDATLPCTHAPIHAYIIARREHGMHPLHASARCRRCRRSMHCACAQLARGRGVAWLRDCIAQHEAGPAWREGTCKRLQVCTAHIIRTRRVRGWGSCILHNQRLHLPLCARC